jgi:hypothetical protein
MIAPRVRIRWVLIPLTLVGLSCTASRTEDTPPDPPNSSTEASVPEEAVSPTATATTAAPVRHNLFSQAGALAFLVDLPEGATGPGIDRALATLIGENGFSPDFPFIELAGGQEPVWVQLLSSGPFDARTLQLFAAMAVYGTGGDDRGATIPWDKRLEDALLRIVIATPAGNEFPELDDRTRQILVDAWLANIAQHVASGVEGGRAWYEPATTIEIEESFRRVGDSYEGVLWMVSDDGSRSEVPTEARLTNGRWVIDAFDLLAPEPIVLAFSYEDVETTDITVVVSAAGGEGDPAVEIIEVTDVTVVDNAGWHSRWASAALHPQAGSPGPSEPLVRKGLPYPPKA